MISRELQLKLKYSKWLKNNRSSRYKSKMRYINNRIMNKKERSKELKSIFTNTKIELEPICNYNEFIYQFKLCHLNVRGSKFSYNYWDKLKNVIWCNWYGLVTKEDYYNNKFNNKLLKVELEKVLKRHEYKDEFIKQITRSPRLSKFLENYLPHDTASILFKHRSNAPQKFNLIITDDIVDIAEMSMRGIESCQSWQAHLDKEQCFDNLLDKNMVIAYLANSSGRMICRTILRKITTGNKVAIGIDRVYGQHLLKNRFVKNLIKHINNKGYDAYSLHDYYGLETVDNKTIKIAIDHTKVSSGYIDNGVNPYLDSGHFKNMRFTFKGVKTKDRNILRKKGKKQMVFKNAKQLSLV